MRRSRVARPYARQANRLYDASFFVLRVNDAVFKVMHCIATNTRYFSVYGDPRVYPRANFL